MTHTFKTVLIAGGLALTSAAQAFAQDTPATNAIGGWNVSATIYGWASSINGTTQDGDDLELTFSDIIDNLDMTLMGTLRADKGKWSLFTDVIYLNLGNTIRTTANVVGTSARVRADVDLKSWVNTTGVGYEVFNDGSTQISGLAGFRYLKLDTDIDFEIGPVGQKFSGSDDYFDGIVGFRGTTDLNEDWYLTYYADIGTGQSDLTYQLFAGVNYRFNNWDAVVGYRYMNWDLGSGGALEDLALQGPVIGARFRF